tara:strand:- start:99 stop:1229 length:1131 start_codon:yes stop_codon:yes gene_type:complete
MKFPLLVIILFFISACDSIKTETIEIGSKETQHLKIKDFPGSLKAKNVILVVGDGTGLNQITASRLAIGGPDHKLSIDQLPHQGISLTHSFDDIYTDSAAAATAWATGFKTKNKYLSINAEKKKLKTILEMLDSKGYLSGIVATSSVTHATPAAFYSHIDSRYKEIEIANQLVNSSVNISLGGGQEFFDLDELKKTHHLLTNKESLKKNFITSKRIIGLFDKDGIVRSPDKPSQREMTDFALEQLKNNKCSGFFLMTEGSQIDWAAHDNNIVEMIEEFKDFDETIMDLINFVTEDQETLLIITADHETGGLKILNQKNGFALIQWGTGSHTSEPVGVYAYGPGAELFNGMMDNTDIHYKILEAIDYMNLDDTVCDL